MKIDPLLRALADSTRLRIMRLLAHMELAVGELALVLEQSQPRVSRHIKILCDAGLAERRKEGSWVFLRSAVEGGFGPSHGSGPSSALGAATAQLLTAAENEDEGFAVLCAADRQHLASIRAAREATAVAYFDRHAEEWDTLRSLHSPDGPVEMALGQALADLRCGVSLGQLLDIGTGTGRMAELFFADAEHVTGVDKSPEMLRLARARLQHVPPDRASLVQGDFTALPFEAESFDTILLHQVLHYAQEPEWVLAEAARVVRPRGVLAIVDFAAHDLEDLRTTHAHARLGFSDEQMAGLMRANGFTVGKPIALEGSPLTVKIWTGMRANHAAPSV